MIRIWVLVLVFVLILANHSTPRHAEGETQTIAVVDFQPINVPRNLALIVSELLRTELVSTGVFNMIERGQYKKVQEEQSYAVSDFFDSKKVVKLGRLVGANIIVVGSVSKVNGNLVLNARMVDVGTGIIRGVGLDKSAGTGGLVCAVHRLVSSLVNSPGVKELVSVRRTPEGPVRSPSGKQKRNRMVLAPLRIERSSRNKILALQFANEFRKRFEEYLIQTGRFTMHDNLRLNVQNFSNDRKKSGDGCADKKTLWDKKTGTDFITVILIENFYVQKKVIAFRTVGSKLIKTKLNVKLSLRLIEGTTNRIIIAENFHFTDLNTTLERFANGSSKTISVFISDYVYPISVISLDNNMVTINRGGKSVRVGDRFNLIRLGESLTDPDSKEKLGRKESIIGEIELRTIKNKYSIGTVFEVSDRFEQMQNIENLIVRRIANKKPSYSLGHFKKTKRPQRIERTKTFENRIKKDW